MDDPQSGFLHFTKKHFVSFCLATYDYHVYSMYASQKVAYISCIHEYFFSIEELKTRDLDWGSPKTISLDSGW